MGVVRLTLSIGVFTLLTTLHFVCPSKKASPRIAIVGAGIGGATTAFYLRQPFGEDALIDVYEKDQVGGRLATVHINNEDIESGGSIIHPANKYMVNFTQMFNLRARDKKAGQMSLFDGEDILFQTSHYSVVTMIKLFWRYGISIVYLEDFINLLLSDFSNIYSTQESGHAFTTPELLLASMSPLVLDMLHEPLNTYLLEREYDQIFIDELVTGGILANYGQGTNVHAFVGAISLAGIQPGLWSVHGGNKQIPINLIERSKSNLRSAAVTLVTSSQDGPYSLTSIDNKSKLQVVEEYDIVVIATPLEDSKSGIKFDNNLGDFVNKDSKFHRTVSTFVNGQLKPGPFGFNSKSDITRAILLTNTSFYYKSFGRHESVIYKASDKTLDDEGRGVWKLFSSRLLTSDDLDEFFTDIIEVKVVDWMAYPEYTSMSYGDALPRFEAAPHLYYVNAFEWAASTMETQSIAGRNVALLAINRWENNEEMIDSELKTGRKKSRDEL